MDTYRIRGFSKFVTTASYLLMIVVNALANILPINGNTTGQVSNSYPNLFAPAAFTFLIWGLIYFLLAAYTLYQLGLFQNGEKRLTNEAIEKVNLYFIISSLANVAWIFAWHYHVISLSMVLMIVILLCLIMIARELNQKKLTRREKLFIRLPFSIYFGWITVATIANATTLLVSWGSNGFGLADEIWTVVMIIIGLAITGLTVFKNRDIAYGLVVIWAYVGILFKHTSANGFAGHYPFVITTVIFCLVCLTIVEGYVLLTSNGFKKTVS